MSGSTRPSIESVRRSLIVGILVGIILGCIAGLGFGSYYAWQVDPAIYADGAFPPELTQDYQSHYLAMVIDSYLMNGQVDTARERLKTFDDATQIEALGRWSAIYVAAGRGPEAQAINQLAVQLSQLEGWSPETISTVAGQLAAEFQSDTAKAQAITSFASQLGQVPVPSAPPAAEGEPASGAAPTQQAPSGGGLSVTTLLLLLCLVVLLIVIVAFIVYRRVAGTSQTTVRAEPVWEGEGPAPLKRWTGTYTLGQDTYDEFFTIETKTGDFLGESGIGILEAIPGTSPKQVVAFDVGLFDKTDITTLSRVLMSEHAYNDDALRAKVDANPQAEAVLAEPGKAFTLETSALRVEATIDELVYGEGGNTYFDTLTVSLDIFVKEGADLKVGSMDVPDQYRV
jgi:hypothetical protein